MNIKIRKFGGSSVKDATIISRVIDILSTEKMPQIVVVSAFGGVTDDLLRISDVAATGDASFKEELFSIESRHIDAIKSLIDSAKAIEVADRIKNHLKNLENLLEGIYRTKELTPRTKDAIVSHGELLSSVIISEACLHRGLNANWLDSRELIKTNSDFGKAKVNIKRTFENIKKGVDSNKINIAPGFISSDEDGNRTTLGRGGSDYTAAIYAAALDAEILEIWTDVSGMMTADPRKVKKAYPVPHLTYSEAMELSHFGAKVIYPPTILPALKKNIPIQIKNTFEPQHEGTLISAETNGRHKVLSGISSIDDISMIQVQGSGLKGVSGIAARLFQAVSRESINIILITQGSSEHSITFAISPKDAARAKALIEEAFELELQLKLIDPIEVENDLCVVAAVGENMKNIPGIAATFFEALGRNGINVRAIAQGASELNISVVVGSKDEAKALNAIHESFFLSGTKTANLFIVGTGTIGSTLIQQIKEHAAELHEKFAIDVKVSGLANSRKMLFDADGINLEDWNKNLMDKGKKSEIKSFVQEMDKMNLRNSIFIDNTAHELITNVYEDVLNASVSIVTPNKIANASSMDRYRHLHKMAHKFGVQFMYETNVGAGLPIISTLKDLMKSGDTVLKIEAMLSGSLGYIFSECGTGRKFSDVVKEALKKGYTEPDPKIDLSGMDVARKILILGRETGAELALEDIEAINCLSSETQKASNREELFELIEKHDDKLIKEKISNAEEKGKRIKYVATFENGKAKTALMEIGSDHPFYNITGTGNIVSFTTARYKTIPLVVTGPGAGAEVTAAGVFADVIRIANY